MTADAFSNCHPAVNFPVFVGAIGFGVLIQHPAYLIAGRSARRFIICCSAAGRPEANCHAAAHVSRADGGEPAVQYLRRAGAVSCVRKTLHGGGMLYGAAIAGVLVMMLWFSCYNAVMTSDKFTSLFGNLIPAISLLLVMVLRMIPSFIRKAGQIMGARKSVGLGAGENSTMKEKLTSGMRTLSALTDWALEGHRDRGLHARPGLRHSQTHKLSDLPDEGAGLDASCSDAYPCGCGRSGGRHGRRGSQVLRQLADDPCRILRRALLPLRFLFIPSCTTLKEAVQWHISRSRI